MSEFNTSLHRDYLRFAVVKKSPLVSVITINWNNATGLRKTLESAFNQKPADFEHIVIDGASTDESVRVIEEFEAGLSSWSSERDNGVYSAMNKGIARARGKYLLFLNAGDHLANCCSLQAAEKWLTGEDLVYFDLEIRDGDGKALGRFAPPDRLSLAYFISGSLPHPSSFISSELFSRHGGYDENMRICADWKAFLLWVCKFNCTYKMVPETLSVFYKDGVSSKEDSKSVILRERQTTLEAEFSAIYRECASGAEAQQLLKVLRRNTCIRVLQNLKIMRPF